jgi:hypothetical protein
MATDTFKVGRSKLRGGAQLRVGETPLSPGLAELEGTQTEGLRFASGWGMNLLSRCFVEPEMYPAADSVRPITNLWDGRLSRPARFSATDTAPRITADLDMLGQGSGDATTDADGWTVPDDVGASFQWTSGGGLLTLITDPTARGGIDVPYKDVRVRAGERLSLTAQATGYDAGNHARVSLQNRANGYYLDPATSLWTTTQTFLLDDSGPSTSVALDFVVQNLEECNGWDQVYLRWVCSKTGATSNPVTFAGMALWPAYGFFGVWYPGTRDMGSPQVLNLYGSETGEWSGEQVQIKAADEAATLVPKRGVSFFDFSAAPQNFRYVRIVLESASAIGDDEVEYCEMILAYLSELSELRDIGLRPDTQIEVSYPQAIFESASGETFRYLERDTSSRKVPMSFRLTTEDEVERFRYWLHGQARGGAEPTLMVYSAKHGSDMCLFGRFDSEPMRQTLLRPRGTDGNWCVEVEVAFQEAPGPVT